MVSDVSCLPIHGKLLIDAVRCCLDTGRARMVSIAPPLPMSTKVAGEEGSLKVVSLGLKLDELAFGGEGKNRKQRPTLPRVVHYLAV